MKINLNLKYSILSLFLLACLPTAKSVAQRGYTMNFLSLTPQQNDYNPAYFTRYEGYFGFPFLSNLQVQVNNDAFSISRAFKKVLDTNGNIKPVISQSGILAGLSERNNLGVEVHEDIFRIGFKAGENNQFHIGLGIDGYANVLLSKQTLTFALAGPGVFIGRAGSEALSGNYVDLNTYASLSFGYSREINKKLSVGTRVKLLSGIANVYTQKSEVQLFIDDGYDPQVTPYSYTIKPDLVVNASLPGTSEDSNLVSSVRNLTQNMDFSAVDLFKNFGIGLDFGAVYQVNDILTIGASVYDIGFINWKNNVKKMTSDGRTEPFTFSGIGEIEDLFAENSFDVKNTFKSIVDSLSEFFQLNEKDSTFKSYRGGLRTGYNISGFFNLTDNDQFGLMWNAQLGKREYKALTIAYTRSFGRGFQVCVNNAFINGNALNFGGGFAMDAGGFQFYLVIDKISSFRVVDMRAVNVQLGINITINRTEKDPIERYRVGKRKDLTPRDRTGYVNDRWAW